MYLTSQRQVTKQDLFNQIDKVDELSVRCARLIEKDQRVRKNRQNVDLARNRWQQEVVVLNTLIRMLPIPEGY